MEYRAATIHDLDALIELRIAFLNAMQPFTEAELAMPIRRLPAYFRQHLGRDFFAWLAVEGDQIVSTVQLVVCEQPANPRMRTGKTGLIINVYTKPDFRKRGLASVLLRMAMEEAKRHDVSYIELQATESGQPVYEKLGFQPVQLPYTYMEYRCGAPDDGSTDPA